MCDSRDVRQSTRSPSKRLRETILKKLLTVAVLVIALGGAVTTANAASLRVSHNKPFAKMTNSQKVSFLKRQIHKDHSVIRFWHNNPRIRWAHRYIYGIQVHWAKTSLKIVTHNLALMLRRNTYSGSITSGSVPQLICKVFGSACPMALRVAYRESRYSIYATNGQYLGIFQMGSAERARFATIGYSTAYEQIIAAHNYFLVSGWGPWSQTAY